MSGSTGPARARASRQPPVAAPARAQDASRPRVRARRGRESAACLRFDHRGAPKCPLPSWPPPQSTRSRDHRSTTQSHRSTPAAKVSAAAVPIGIVAWLRDRIGGRDPFVEALLICFSVGLLWELALTVVLVRRETGRLCWSHPASPRRTALRELIAPRRCAARPARRGPSRPIVISEAAVNLRCRWPSRRAGAPRWPHGGRPRQR